MYFNGCNLSWRIDYHLTKIDLDLTGIDYDLNGIDYDLNEIDLDSENVLWWFMKKNDSQQIMSYS